ncbi:hypothetical protein NFI95_10970 [Acetobacteraceae bacterium KSS8]|uniref:Uncharacterized protein n=1 Tax=Endosaccharibacter trunci TaxID=2812733 RepID=A0ABT1W7V3_9PROT|nr:hypothetical protein [Acetobacteraceae bacterium KSS8]
MVSVPTQDLLSGFAAETSTSGTAVMPFAGATISSANGDDDLVTCYVLNDNLAAGSLDASALPAGSFIAPSGTLVEISGGVATVQAALRALQFDAAAIPAGQTLSAHLTIVMSNTAGGVTSDRSIVSTVVDNHGINVVLQNLGNGSTVSDTVATAFLPTLVVVSAASDAVGVTVSMSDRTLGAFTTGSVSGVTTTTNPDGSVTLSGSAAAVGAGLQSLRFSPAGGYLGTTGTETFTVSARDLVNGTTATGTATLAITGSHSAVSISGNPAELTLSGGSSSTPLQSFVLRNAVQTAITATATLTDPSQGHFDISALPAGSAAGVSSQLSADGSTVVLTGGVAAVQADLNALRFLVNNPASGSTNAQITLNVSTAANGSASATEGLTINSSGSAPVLSGSHNVSVNGGSGVLYPDLSLAGPTTPVTATVSLSDPSIGGFDRAGFAAAESGNAAVSYAFSSDGTSLQVQGNAADVTSALHLLRLTAANVKTGSVAQETATLQVSANAGTATFATAVAIMGATLVADAVTGIATTATAVEGKPFTPFGQAVISDPNIGDTVLATVTSSAAGLFVAGSLAAGTTLSSDGTSVTISGSATSVQAALAQLSVRMPDQGAGSQVSLSVALSNQAGNTTLSSASVTQTITVNAAGYGSDTSSDATAHVFYVGSDPNLTASIDLSDNHNSGIIVFGGNSALSLRGANSVIVLNGPHQNGALNLQSLGNDAVWVGTGAVDCTAGGHTRFILGDMANTSSTVTLHGGGSSDTSEFDVWGDASELQTIKTDGASASTIFGGGANLNYSGGNSTVVLNGAEQTGHVTIHSTGGNTVWAGVAGLDFFEGAGNDTVLLTGSAATTIHGASSPETGTTTVMSFGNRGTFTYQGSDKAANLSLSGGNNIVQGGAAQQTIAMSGSGSLTVSDNGASTGVQSIVMNQSASASLQFLGGGNPAKLVLGAGAATIHAGVDTNITGGSASAVIDLSDAVNAVLSFNGRSTGNLDITGYDPSRASVQLSGVVSSSVQGGSLIVGFADGAHATFHNVTDGNHSGISFT